jgi:hypothetical protein
MWLTMLDPVIVYIIHKSHFVALCKLSVIVCQYLYNTL